MSDSSDSDFREVRWSERAQNGTHSSYLYSMKPPRERLWLHVVLFLATAYTTTFAGMLMSPALGSLAPPDDLALFLNPRYLVYGLPFSATLLAILGIHEMGHYLASRYWGVRATLPFFIPFPSMIGTLGAVIKMRSRIPNRRALIDIGASGPLAGFVVAIIALGVGLSMSQVVPTHALGEGSFSLGDSLLTAWMGKLVIGQVPPGYDVVLHPVAFAGWLGLFVTVLNLLPMGQFDGGHIVYAVFGQRHALISRLTLVGLGLFWAFGPPYDWLHASSLFSAWESSRWPGWLIWMFMALILGRNHPATENSFVELDPARRWVGYVSLAIFVLCFIPNPIRIQ